LVVPTAWLSNGDTSQIVPSIEVQLSRFAKRDVTTVFFVFFVVQVALEQALLHFSR
jgi:hypothetical protein